MTPFHRPLFTDAFLARHFALEYAQFRGSTEEAALLARLQHWSDKHFHTKGTAETMFVDVFLKETWNYQSPGTRPASDGFNLYPQFPIHHAAPNDEATFADLALGWFERSGIAATPQAICEFKDAHSGLDKPQRRKGSDRSPVQQCADYLKEASKKLFGNEPIQPTWAIVSDMNEVRLYWRRTMPSQTQRFVLRRNANEQGGVALLDSTEQAQFQRFVFTKLFDASMLLTTGGPSKLEKLVLEQGHHEQAIENEFYREYQHYRERIFKALVQHNPGFPDTRGKLVRLAQRLLDQCILLLFCEDMGTALPFPPHLLRDLLVRESLDPHYDPADGSVWHKVKRLFVAMRDGTPFGDVRINRFNGGLFAEEPDLESLAIPNDVFCVKGQGASEASLIAAKETLLFFSAHYNFCVRGGELQRSIGLHTLGRIFEQSIVDLEFMEANADNRPSLTELSKRKRDGVYYTPEWITHFLVEETLGTHLLELRKKYKIAEGPVATADDYLARLDAYAQALNDVKVVDPACGAGVFLIQALDRFVQEWRWVITERDRIAQSGTSLDLDKITRDVVTNNLYGVDINPESVEMTRLVLWLHSALPERLPCSLNENIRCGNSLVAPDFYERSGQRALCAEHARERIHAFDWHSAFPDVFSRPDGKAGFDIVVGNPPYVKLQNLRKVNAAVATYLVESRSKNGATPRYESTQTKNFDLYLPFIEKGIELLNQEGRMGYIAPSVWLTNEYGAGLRQWLHRTRRLERWLDFNDFQVFRDAATYTSLQFFRGKPCPTTVCNFAPDGYVAGTEWSRADALIDMESLDPAGPWYFLRANEQALLNRLRTTCATLDTYSIVVGVQTSADWAYHLERIGPGKYRYHSKHGAAQDVAIEDAIMRPLVSGEAAKRYQSPRTSTYILFPYDDTREPARLFTPVEMSQRFPGAWAHLQAHEQALRARESGKFDDDAWYRFGRHQNIGKQKLPKLLIPRLTVTLGAAIDSHGSVCLDNVDVNGILAHHVQDLWFLAALINAPVANCIWRLTSKPFQNNFRAANKQFIGPLPIVPHTDATTRKRIAEGAEKLQSLHTERKQCRDENKGHQKSGPTTDHAQRRPPMAKERAETLDTLIASAESAMNEMLYDLYGLTNDERKLVEAS